LEYRSTRIVGWVESAIPIVHNLDLLAVKRTRTRMIRLSVVGLRDNGWDTAGCASAPYKLLSFFVLRKYMPAVRRQFDAGVLPDDQIHVTCELRQQRHAVDLDFRERRVAKIISVRHFADVAGNPIAG
jgi:hypothetical protein